MKVLFISQAYPPYPAVGSLRARKLVDALRRQGHEVQVVTERLDGDRGALRAAEDGLLVHTVPVGERYRARVAAAVRRVRTLFGRLGQFVLALLRVPDDEQRFILPAYRVARRLMRRQRFDLVYTSAPSFSTLLVGLLLRRTTGCRWVAEFRDPWTDQRAGHDPGNSELIRAVHRWLERRCLNAADQVVTVTEGAREQLRSKVPAAQRDKFVLALNGIDALTPPADREAGPFRIVYAGTFYFERDPRPFLDALRDVVVARALDPGALRVDFVGHCRNYHAASVEQMVADRGLTGFVHFRDWVPHEEAQRLLRSADLLLFIALGQPLQVPNKLYDYLGTRRAILAFVDADGESARMLERVGGHHLVSDVTVPNVAAALDAALGPALDGPTRAAPAASVGDESVLRRWLTERQLGELVRAIGV